MAKRGHGPSITEDEKKFWLDLLRGGLLLNGALPVGHRKQLLCEVANFLERFFYPSWGNPGHTLWQKTNSSSSAWGYGHIVDATAQALQGKPVIFAQTLLG